MQMLVLQHFSNDSRSLATLHNSKYVFLMLLPRLLQDDFVFFISLMLLKQDLLLTLMLPNKIPTDSEPQGLYVIFEVLDP